MAHKQCLEGLRLNHLCDCINDDIIELNIINHNIENLENLVRYYFKKYDKEINIKHFTNYLKLRLKIENELEE